MLQQLLGFIVFGWSQSTMTSMNAHPGDAHLAMPLDIAIIVDEARWRTQKQAGLALMHAVQLDRQLRQMGFLEPVTYAQHGVATLGKWGF